jgi:hypothetical protein
VPILLALIVALALVELLSALVPARQPFAEEAKAAKAAVINCHREQ